MPGVAAGIFDRFRQVDGQLFPIRRPRLDPPARDTADMRITAAHVRGSAQP